MIELQPGGNAPVDGHQLTVAVSWSAPPGLDPDVSAFLLGENGKVGSDLDMIFYNQPAGGGGALRLEVHPGRGFFRVDLSRLPPTVARIPFCLTVGNAPFSALQHAQVIVDVDGRDLRFVPERQGARESAMILGELYRRQGTWKFRAVGQGFDGGLGPLARSYGIVVDNEPARPPTPTPAYPVAGGPASHGSAYPPAGPGPASYQGGGYPPAAPHHAPGSGSAYPPAHGAGAAPAYAPATPYSPPAPAHAPVGHNPAGYPPAHGHGGPSQPASQTYPPAGSGYPPATPAYPPATPAYPPASSGYPPAGSGYPPATPAYPPATPAYPPATPAYPPASSGYRPTSSSYPPASPGYAPASSGHSPGASHYPPATPYPSQPVHSSSSAYPPAQPYGGGGHGPSAHGNYPPAGTGMHGGAGSHGAHGSPVILTSPDQVQHINIDQNSSSRLIASAVWIDNGDGRGGNDDLDLRVGMLLPNGSFQMIHAPRNCGAYDRPPYIRHTGDVRETGSRQPGREVVEVNPAIGRHMGRPIGLVFSVYSAAGNGAVSVASLQPRMRLEYRDQVVDCAFDFARHIPNAHLVYTYVLGTVVIDLNGITLQPSGVTSRPESEDTPRLTWGLDGRLRVTVDGPPLFK